MAVKRLPWAVFCAGICLISAISQPLGRGVISGTVIEGENDEAVRKAIVTLTLDGNPHRWATARTDGSGHFQFDGLPAGKYTLRAAKGDEGTAIYGAKSVRELGDAIVLADAETRGGITLRFLHGASISGHVMDADGEPVAHANVTLLRQGRNLGAPIVTNFRGASTDDRGEYHFTNIDPGRYYIRVSPGGGLRFGGMPVKGQTILLDQYYGGVRDSKDASPVHVSGEDHLTDLDFHLTSEAPAEIHGQVLGVPDVPESERQQTPTSSTGITFIRNGAFVSGGGSLRNRGPTVQVMVSRADAGQATSTIGTAAQGAEHRFEMDGMTAGRYRIEASIQAGGKSYGASQIVDLHPGSTDVALTLAPAGDIQGTVRVEGQTSNAKGQAGPENLQVELQRPGTVRHSITAQVSADGHFTLGGVIPGEWNLDVTSLSKGFLKSVQFGDKDVRFTTFEVPANNDATLNIVVSMRTASVDGEIDAGASDGTRAGIMIARTDQLHTYTRFYYATEADAKGKFHIEGIAPGKYKAFALEKMDARGFRNSEIEDALDELGETIDLAEGATVEAHPKLIPMERAEKALQ